VTPKTTPGNQFSEQDPQPPGQFGPQNQEQATPHQSQGFQNNPMKLITDLMKIYNNNDKKYSGELYDILDVKLQVFYNCYNKVGLPEAQYHNAFSVMLKDEASNFYYSKITGRPYDFITMINMIKMHFKTEENRQFYMSEWRETTLPRVITSNPTKSKLECLQMLFNKL
jgi:hypothetical protein